MGDVGRPGGAEGHFDAVAGAGGALGEGGVGASGDVAQGVEEDPVRGVVAFALGEWRWTQGGCHGVRRIRRRRRW